MSDAAPHHPADDRYPGAEDPDVFESPEFGLAAERTDLAWSRSGLALMACGVVVAKGLPAVTASAAQPITGGVILVLGGLTWLIGLGSARRRRHQPGQERPVARLPDLAPVAIGTAAVGTAGVVLVLIQHG